MVLLYSFPHTSQLGIPQNLSMNHDKLPGLPPATRALPWLCPPVCEIPRSSRKQFGNATAAPWFLAFVHVARARSRLLTEKQAESRAWRSSGGFRHLVEVSGEQASLLPLEERACHLFGKEKGKLAQLTGTLRKLDQRDDCSGLLL
jgi:hypothetical protein